MKKNKIENNEKDEFENILDKLMQIPPENISKPKPKKKKKKPKPKKD